MYMSMPSKPRAVNVHSPVVIRVVLAIGSDPAVMGGVPLMIKAVDNLSTDITENQVKSIL
jgi:hypothetical protein